MLAALYCLSSVCRFDFSIDGLFQLTTVLQLKENLPKTIETVIESRKLSPSIHKYDNVFIHSGLSAE